MASNHALEWRRILAHAIEMYEGDVSAVLRRQSVHASSLTDLQRKGYITWQGLTLVVTAAGRQAHARWLTVQGSTHAEQQG